MIKDIVKYLILGGLLYGGHYFLSEMYPQRGLLSYKDVSQFILLLLFILSHILTVLISKKYNNVLLGQVFLGFSVFKLVSAGILIFVIKKISEDPISKSFILVFMGSYFLYLTLDVFTMLRNVKKGF